MKIKLMHLVRLSAVVLLVAAILFLAGLAMEQTYRQQVFNAVISGKHVEAAKLLYDRQQKGEKPDTLFYDTKAIIHLNNGNIDAAIYNLEKSLELQGK